MEKFAVNKMPQRLIALTMIFIMLISYFLMISLATEDRDEVEDNVVLEVKWSGNNDGGDSVLNAYTGSSYALTYNLKFNNVPTGFQDVKLAITNKAGTPIANIRADNNAEAENIQNGQYSQITFGNKNTGKEFGGEATVTFGENSERYEKEIVVTLTGSYKENGETVNFTKQEILKADVIPATRITNYLTNVEMQTNSWGERVTSNSVNMGMSQYGRTLGWYATQVTAEYPIHINSYTHTQKLKLDITINRITNKSKLEEDGFMINWGGLEEELGTPTEKVNSDGSRTYTFTKGKDGTELKSGETFALDKDFTVLITYPIPNSNPENGGELKEANTTCKFMAELEGTGYIITKEYGKEQKIEQVTRKTSINKSNYVGLYRYTPGNHAWINTSLSTAGSAYIEEEDINNFIENGSIDLNFRTTTDNSCNWGDKEGDAKGYLNFSNPTISYLSDSGKIENKTLNSSQIRVKKIEGQSGADIVYNGNDSVEMTSTTYNMPENIDVSSFSIALNDFMYKYYYGYNITYTLNTDKLGLTESELKNILSIDLNMSTSGNNWCKGGGSASYYNTASLGNKYSYMEFEAFDFGTESSKKNQEESKKYTIKMYKNSKVMKTTQLAVINENPVFYISLPSAFKYSNFNVSMQENPYIAINDEKSHFTTINGEKYLVIVCDGTYDSTKQGEIDITIDFTRKLVSNASEETQTIYAYMLTDNERYFYEGKNNLRVEKNNVIPEKAFLRTISFNISGSKTITATTSLERDDNSNVNYEPNPANTTVEYAEKEQPVIIDSNSSVIYKSEIVCAGDTLKNISIISKLPIAYNTYINDNNTQLLENDYQLPEAFYKKYGNNIKDFEQGDTITQVSLQDLNIENIKVYKNNNYEMERNKYTLYYSTEDVANFTTDNFIEYHEGDDLSQAKNLMVVFKDDVTLTSGSKYTLQYKMTMPEEKGMIGATTAVKYNKTSDGKESTLYSPVAYVINGITTGTINVTKKFEGLSSGIAPEGINISGIEFKLQYFDEKENERKFLKDSEGNDIIARTNDKGVATFENIPYGEDYYLYEVTEFDKYLGIGNLVLVELDGAETANIVVENKIKRGEIIIKKSWTNTNDNQGQVTFKITRNNNDKIKYEATVVTDDDGIAKVVGVPYGNYTVSETQCIPGWISTGNQTVELDTDEKEVNMENRPANSSLQIIKTVPEGETVDGLTFHISGFGVMNYIDDKGKEVTNNTDITVKIGEDYSSNDQIEITKSDDGTTATITLNNLPLGLYNIEEIDIPILEGTEIEKYVSVFVNKTLDTDISITKQPEVVRISNKYKYGTLDIYKIAKLKEGNTFTDIGDLSVFQVLVSGTSYYGTNVNKIINLDENGYGTTKLEIGEYTVKEIGVEGYTAYYGTDDSATTEPPTVKINYNQTTKQAIYNEHTGVGYVRVEKSLEGVSEPEKVIKAGIKFQIIGQNIAGGRVNEIIEINKIDTEKNVAYGVSGAISTDGEYELQEIESTIPEFYEGIEPMEINIKTSNTQNDPLVINAVNNRTKGNLEIITETNPTGGSLYGITYRVTEVEINTNGTYQKIGKSIELEGNNDTIKTSFAEMKEINAGYYLVEQVNVPDGWYKDVSQVVEVPSYNTGYANFEITKKPELGDNKLTINKVVLNQNGEKATDTDYEHAKLNKDESFEVQITNVKTGEVYYVFVSEEKRGVIQGLESGTYRIEEVYKPKYITEGYYQHIEIEPNEIEGVTEDVENAVIEHKIAETNGQYLITIGMDGDTSEDVEITVKNKINTEFGFGGQHSRDNLNKTSIEEDKIVNVSKAVIYVVDENNKAISGAKFRLLNSEGKVVTLNGRGSEFEIANKKLTIRGLGTGKYTLECVEVPNGYLKPENKELIVFEDATQVARVEIQKNIPRGSITLSTVYTTEDGETKYIPRSKYKVVDKETGELIRFIRTSTGDYKKTNLASGSPIIVLKSGAVEVEGIEIGEYEVGIVDVTKGYGITTTTPENVTIEENTSTNVSIEVIKKNIAQVEAGYQTSMYLDENGDLYAVGGYSYGLLGDGNSYSQSSQFKKVEFPAGVKISKFSFNHQSVVAIDTEGRAWGWGYSGCGVNGLDADKYSPTLIANGSNRFADVSISSETGLLLDKDGYVWATGYYVGDGKYDKNTKLSNPILQFVNSGIKVKKLAQMRGYSSNAGVIDIEGKIWMWGPNSKTLVPDQGTIDYTPRCISEVAGIEEVEFEELVLTDNYAMALDNEGSLWLWGSSNIIEESMLQGAKNVPTKVDSNYFGNKKIKLITGSSYYSSSDVAIAVDEDGKVWTWGNGTTGQLGNGANASSGIPVCISDIQESKLYGVEIKDIGISYNNVSHVIAVDTNNKIYAWGGNSTYGEAGEKSTTSIISPQIINNTYNEHLEYNLKFKEVFSEYNKNSFAIDEEGRLWAWGNNYNNALGINTNGNNILIPTEIEIPGNPKMKKVSSYYNTTIMLSEDGRVYVCGEYAYTGDGKMVSRASIIEITSNFNLPDDEKIVDVYTVGSTSKISFIAIDSEGKLYTWGSGNCIGRKDNAGQINCISDDAGEVLNGIKINKIFSNGSYNIVLAIADNGDLYYWQDTNEPTLLSSGNNFVDIQCYYLLDESGKIWTIDYGNISRYGTGALVCRSDIPENILYQYYKKDPNYRILKIYDASDYECSAIIFRDSNGEIWGYRSSANDVFKLTGTISLDSSSINTELMPKNFTSISGWLLLDEYGQIWIYKNISNSYGEAGNGTTTSITNPICLTSSDINTVYKLKMKNILSDQLVVDEKGRLYQFDRNTNSTLNGISPVEYIEGTLGVKIVKSCTNENKITSYVRAIESIAIDENGKLWEGNYTTVTNLSEVEDSELAKKYKEDSNFKIEKIYYNNTASGDSTPYSTKYAIDNYGKLWTWGVNYSGQCGNGTTTYVTSPTCISDIDGVNLKDVESIEFVGASVIAKDKDGNLWVWGDNTNGRLGNGKTSAVTKPYCINTEKLDGKAIKDIIINECGLILCDDDSVYVSGDTNINGKTDWTNVGTCEGAEKIFMVQVLRNGQVYIISGQNKVWTFGKNNPAKNGLGMCGTGSITEDYIKIPTLISEDFTIKTCYNNVTNEYYNSTRGYRIKIIDTDGELWLWGGSEEKNVIKPIKLSEGYKAVCFSSQDYCYIMDDKGIIHDGDNNYDISKAIKDIYGEINQENIDKYINLYKSGATYVLHNGKLWDIEFGHYGNMLSYDCLNNVLGSELNGKTIVDASKYKAIDSNGNLYVWSQYTGLESSSVMPICTTNIGQYAEATFKANNTVINVPDKNNLYGVKIKQLINDKFVIDEKDNIWYFTESGKAENLSSNYQEITNPLHGKTIKQVINSNYVITEDDEIWYVGGQYPGYVMKAVGVDCNDISMNLNECGYENYIAIDKYGKLWTCGKDKFGYGILGTGNYDTKGEPVCLSDIKGTDLYEATQNNPNFKIEKILSCDSSWCLVLDNSGKIWSWGAREASGQNKIISPICISNIKGTDLYNAYENDSTFRIVGTGSEICSDDTSVVEDSNGYIWCVDSTTNTWKRWQDIYANGDLEIAFSNPDFRISKVKYLNSFKNIVIGNNGKVYIEDGEYKVINNISNAYDIARSYYTKDTETNSLYKDTYRCVIFSDEGLYQIARTTTMQRSYSSSTGWSPWVTSHGISTSKLASCKIKQIIDFSDSFLALDENGKMWVAGYVGGDRDLGYDFGSTRNITIKCLSDDSNYALYGIEIDEIIKGNNKQGYLKEKDGKIYTTAGKEYIDTTASEEYEELIEELYGEVNNENISNFNNELDLGNIYIKIDNKWYRASIEDLKVKLTEVDFAKENINKGIKLTKVVGENEVQAEDGTIYQIKPSNASRYEMVKVDEATPFEEYEIEPIEIEGSKIIKQTKYKALDDKGNLYVWDNYKGLTTTLNGVICLTNEKYYVEPIYLHSNGWTVIRSQY